MTSLRFWNQVSQCGRKGQNRRLQQNQSSNQQNVCLFYTGANANLISESVIKSSEYLSSISILDCAAYTIWNTTGEIKANKFIELCFRVMDDYILLTIALVVHDFDSVKFLQSISNMDYLNSLFLRKGDRPFTYKKGYSTNSTYPRIKWLMTLTRHYQHYTLLDAAKDNLHQKHHRYWHCLSCHVTTMMKQLWSKYTHIIYNITWTSHGELHTWHIIYCLECKIPHELRIMWYRHSWSTYSICTIFVHLKSSQSHDTNLSTNPVFWLSQAARDICASPDIELRIQSLHPPRNDLSINCLAMLTLYYSHLIRNSTWLCKLY